MSSFPAKVRSSLTHVAWFPSFLGLCIGQQRTARLSPLAAVVMTQGGAPRERTPNERRIGSSPIMPPPAALPDGAPLPAPDGPGGRLTWDAIREAYARDGVVCVRQLFAPLSDDGGVSWVEYLGEECDVRLAASAAAGMMEEYTPAGNPGRFCGEMDVSRRDSEGMAKGENRFRRYVFESPAARLAGTVTGAETVNFFYDFLFVKEPGTTEVTRWHQDETYWVGVLFWSRDEP